MVGCARGQLGVKRAPKLRESITIKRIPHPLTATFAMNETGVTQDLEMMRNCGLTLLEG